jgi:hypothetical protein
VEPAQLPHWLRRMVAGAGNAAGHALVHWRALLREGVREGQRNSTVASVAGHLLWHGVDPQVTLELMICWNRVRCYPPLDEDEVVRTVKSITRLHEREDAQD